MCCLPESQVYYINNNKDDEAKKVLLKGLSEEDAEFEMHRLRYQRKFFISDKVSTAKKYKDLFSTFRRPFLISLGLAFFA